MSSAEALISDLCLRGFALEGPWAMAQAGSELISSHGKPWPIEIDGKPIKNGKMVDLSMANC